MFMLLMALVLVVVTMFLLGWLTVSASENEVAIRIRKWRILHDTRYAVKHAEAQHARLRRWLGDRRKPSSPRDSSAFRSTSTPRHRADSWSVHDI